MAKVKNFKTIFPAVSVPLNDDYSINDVQGDRPCQVTRLLRASWLKLKNEK